MEYIIEDLKTDRNSDQRAVRIIVTILVILGLLFNIFQPVIKLTFKGIRSFRQHFLPDVATLSVLPEHLAKVPTLLYLYLPQLIRYPGIGLVNHDVFDEA